MKNWSRLVAGVTLGLAVGAPAHATVPCTGVANAVFCDTEGISGSGPQVRTFLFDIDTVAVYVATLSDLAFPVAFKELSLAVAEKGGIATINSTPAPGSFEFMATRSGEYALLLFGVLGDKGVGSFSITVAPLAGQPAPVPEPGIWLMMGAGALLVGFVRLRARVGT